MTTINTMRVPKTIREVRVLNSPSAVNRFLRNGWVLLLMLPTGELMLGKPAKPSSHPRLVQA